MTSFSLTPKATSSYTISSKKWASFQSIRSIGPILYPEAREILLKPLCPHVTFDKALMLPPEAVVRLKVITSYEVMLSFDGQVESPLCGSDKIKVEDSPYAVHFLKAQLKTYFYSSLESRLKGKIS
ncbi:hypothetical protein DRH13_04940 [Candidatus Woesebacteria bacterium]|nr:MAG: hypothetical protein DRH13_04940 [Candidatus Woesebacteria bacterium]